MIANSVQSWVDRFSDRKAGHLDQPATQILSRNTTRGIDMRHCEIPGCEKKSQKNKHCSMHAHRFYRHGSFNYRRAPQHERIAELSVLQLSGCIEWQGCDNTQGYAMVYCKKKNRLVGRLLWEREYGKIPEGIYLCHTCDNPKCINLDHFYMGTPKDNVRDMIVRGRANDPCGELAYQAKLKEKVVRYILQKKESNGQAAKRFGVSRSCISAIRTGRSWKQVWKERKK